jgi:uncharacterized membrane protein YdbT with pleckstrin-like domain
MIILDKNEHIVFQIRQHWFVFFRQFFLLFILAIIPTIFIEILKFLPIEIIFSGKSAASFVTFFYTAWIFILWIIGFIFWTDFYLDTWIITNQKVINVEQRGLFRREVSILHIDKIQDVTSDVRGMLKTFIDYGNVHVQTAGQQRDFIIRNVPSPDVIREKLSETIIRFKKEEKNETLPEKIV